MRDVAAQAKVSLKTVSRVVNGESGVSPRLAKRVLAAYGLTGNATPASPSNGEAEETVEAATRRERRKVAVE